MCLKVDLGSKSIETKEVKPDSVNSKTNFVSDFKKPLVLRLLTCVLNVVAHICIGVIVGFSIKFALRRGLPLTSTPLHIVLCVVGYQLLIAEAILGLSLSNIWSSKFKLVNKRRAHWILTILGSGFALAGTFLKLSVKNWNYNDTHGTYGFVAAGFTLLSLLHGLTSLWAYELRSIIKGNYCKITHTMFGMLAFLTANICICYGFHKGSFKYWIQKENAERIIVTTGFLTFIILISPVLNLYFKVKKRK